MLNAGRDGATLRWWGELAAGTPLYWTLPYWVHSANTPNGARVSGRLRLSGASGSVTLRWSARAPAQSYALAVSALNRSYRARGKAAPITPAKDW